MNRITTTAALIAALFVTTLAFAQTDQTSPGMGGRGGQRGMAMSPEARLDRMSQQLNLTDEQKSKIKPILEDETKQMQALHQDTSLSRQDMMAKMQDIHKNTNSQIRPILNADQQKKYEEMQKRMMEHRGGRAGWGGQSGQNPQTNNPPQ